MHDVFISYASADRERAQQVAVALEHHGLQVWWDRQIPPGRTFDEVIEEAIDGARCVVVLWTRNSVASDWVKTEANEGAHDQRLVPAMLDMVKPPLEFRRIQAADLSRWTGDPGDPAFAPLLQAVSQRVRAGDETRQASASDSEAAQSPANARPPPPADRPVTRASALAAPASRRTVGLLAGLGALVVIGVTSRWWLPTPVPSVLPAVVPAVVLPASAPPPSTPAAQAPAASAPEPEAAARVEMPKLTGQTVEEARGALRALAARSNRVRW